MAIRVLVVDDSVVIRRLLTVYLASDPIIEVVGTAADGEIGLAKIAHLNPDLVILDIEMPKMDGLQTLGELRKLYKKLPVIMYSTLTERGAAATLKALSLGASDYATKGHDGGSREQETSGLVDKIKALCGHLVPRPKDPTLLLPKVTRIFNAPAKQAAGGPVEVLAIGSSTGGPQALTNLIGALSPAFPLPIVIVQHMPQIFTRLLAERLGHFSGFPAREAKDGDPVRAGEISVAPGGLHLEVVRDGENVRLRTHNGPQENSCRPAVDVLLRSVAKAYGSRALAVVLTGMGQDGLAGCKAIREAGGRIFVQDEASSVVWGMPGSVARAGLAEKILPVEELAREINRLARRPLGRTQTMPAVHPIPAEAI